MTAVLFLGALAVLFGGAMLAWMIHVLRADARKERPGEEPGDQP